MEEFISEPITVDYDDERMQPVALRWRGETYAVAEVISAWQDWHTPSYADHARSWIHRRHRNYYVVRTAQGPVFEIYLDRGSGKRDWVLLKRKG